MTIGSESLFEDEAKDDKIDEDADLVSIVAE